MRKLAGICVPICTPFDESGEKLDEKALSAAVASERARRPADGLEVHFTADAKVLDGRFANNAWLQELPDPVTKLTWDNAALVSPATAREWGVAQGDRVRIARGGRSVELPVYFMPGMAAGTVAASASIRQRLDRRIGAAVAAAVPDVPESASRSNARSCADWKRRSGFFSMQCRTTRSRPGEML